jgi:hypothetical protein
VELYPNSLLIRAEAILKTRSAIIVCLLCVLNFTTNLHAQLPVAAAAPAAAASPPAAQNKRTSDYLNERLPHWLVLNGEYRTRGESVSGIGFKPDNDDTYALGRLRINMGISPTPWLRFQFQGQDAELFGRNPIKPDAPPHENAFNLRQAYVEAGNLESSKFGLRVGRQELFFGEQRLIGHLNWMNDARSFDAVRASYRSKDYRIDVFAASVVNFYDGAFNDRRTDGNNLHGIYSSFTRLVPKATIEPYLLWRVSRGVKSKSGVTGNQDFETIGLRWVGKLPSNFDYGTEIAGQTGSYSTDEIRAFAGHAIIGYSLPKFKATPRFFTEFNYASGDRNAASGRRGTFDQLYPTGHDKIGLADQVGWRNVEDARGGVELKPGKKITAAGSYHMFWLASSHDGLYNAAGTLVARVADGSAGRYIGQEADVQGTYALKSQIQIASGYTHLFPGTFLMKTTPGRHYNLTYVMVTYLF